MRSYLPTSEARPIKRLGRNSRRLGVVVAATLTLVLALAQPALAGVSYIDHAGGAYARVTWTFSNKTTLSLSFTVTDTKCNSKPAVALATIHGEGFHYRSVTFTNDAGCGTTRSYSTGAFSVGWNIIYIQICADGDGRPGGLATACGSYHDNPYT